MQLTWSDLIELSSSGVETIKKLGGVYRLSYQKPSDGKYYIYYVGQAEDLNSRLCDHLQGRECNENCCHYVNNYNCCFRAALVPAQYRDGVEAALYNKYNPDCCERTPEATPIEINFD